MFVPPNEFDLSGDTQIETLLLEPAARLAQETSQVVDLRFRQSDDEPYRLVIDTLIRVRIAIAPLIQSGSGCRRVEPAIQLVVEDLPDVRLVRKSESFASRLIGMKNEHSTSWGELTVWLQDLRSLSPP
jgi:hypothetical protein